VWSVECGVWSVELGVSGERTRPNSPLGRGGGEADGVVSRLYGIAVVKVIRR